MQKLVLFLGIVLAASPALAETGYASHYGPGFDGRRTASGARFNQYRVSCAHKTLPFGTMVRVTDLATGRMIRCRVLDRGPFVRGRIIDLSTAAARALGMIGRGVARVRVEVSR